MADPDKGMGDVPEEKLARDIAAGDQAAFAALFDRFGACLFASARSLLGSDPDAEDAVQDVWAAVARSRHRLRGVRSVKAYLYKALRNVVVRRWARQRRAVSLDDVSEPAGGEEGPPGPDDRLERALRSLPAEQREVVVLKIDGEMTFAELAEALGISPNTAASRYRYALEKLRDALGAEDDDGASR
jgi:RNA polymerase sigma factor (sigma-70 family)